MFNGKININKINSETLMITKRILEYGKKSPEEMMTIFSTSSDGLNEEEIEYRFKLYGKNLVDYEKPPAWWIQLGHAFLNPFNLILIILAIFSYVLDVRLADPSEKDYTKIILLSLMIFVSVTIRFWQEFNSQKMVEKIKSLVQNKTTVIRHSEEMGRRSIEIPTTDVVPGDIVELTAGDIVPGDLRLLEARDLYVSQSTMTGESLPIEKMAKYTNPTKEYESAFEIPTILLMGTSIITGYAKGIVIGTSKNTYFGSMAQQIIGRRPMTNFDIGINKVSLTLIRFMIIMVPIVFFINWMTKNSWKEALLFSLSIAVGLTPEMLPLIVTSNLAKGSIKMAKKNVIIKKLNAIQNFGAMDVLCTDKTGTITENRVVLFMHLDSDGNNDEQILKLAKLNSYFQTGLRSLMDKAILDHEFEDLKNSMNYNEYTKIDEIPFDFTRRRMSVILEHKKKERVLICKGAVEEIFACSTKYSKMNEIKALDSIEQKQIIELRNHLSEDGLRVIAVSYKPISDLTRKVFTAEDESDLIFAGYIAFLDPPKASAAESIKLLQQRGIKVKIITGDNEIVTKKICKDVNLEIQGVLTGPEIDRMSDEELKERSEKTTIFAKVGPTQKAKLVHAIKSNNHVVGYLGDGVNDAAALKESDVGISVDSGVDIAKETADIILTKNDLKVLREGVEEGRNIFGNILKYIKMTASSNFGNVFSILVASAFLPFLPMLPLQLLIQNLLYDISQISIPWDRVDDEYLQKPRKWKSANIPRFIVFIGPISSIFDIITFLILWYIIGANTIDQAWLFQSGWFVEGLLSQTLIIHMIRTEKIPFIESRATKPVLILTLMIMTIGVALPFTKFGNIIGLYPMPLVYYPLLVLTLFSYCVLIQIIKVLYIKRFKEWL